MNSLKLGVLMVVLLSAQPFSIFAVSVFQWVDAEGITHFSDEIPAEAHGVNELSHYEIDENYPQVQSAEEHYFSIIRQWQRTNAERIAAEKLKQTANRPPRRFQQSSSQTALNEQPSPRYYSGVTPLPYFYPRARGQYQHHFQHHAGKPAPKPGPAAPVRGYLGNVAAD